MSFILRMLFSLACTGSVYGAAIGYSSLQYVKAVLQLGVAAEFFNKFFVSARWLGAYQLQSRPSRAIGGQSGLQRWALGLQQSELGLCGRYQPQTAFLPADLKTA